MPTFKPAYLIHGDDHGRIAERRSRLRALSEAEGGAQNLELFEGDQATPGTVASAINSMTFALGRRFVVVDGVERWRERDLEPLVAALKSIPTDTTVAFFAREDGRMKAPAALREAVRAVGGDVSSEESVKPWKLSEWVVARGRELGLRLAPDAASRLIERVGGRQQRLLRELEKLAIASEPDGQLDAERIDQLSAPSAERRVWSLADAIVAGDARAATRLYLTLRSQGERLPGILYWMAQRLRNAQDAAQAIEAGASPAQVKRALRMPARAADQLIADARRSGSDSLRVALGEVADLELASRGGGPGGANEDTATLQAIQRIAG